MQTIEEKIRQYIEQKNLIPAGGKILVAVSGGADSVCLLYILNKLFPNQIHAAHINHQLRASDSLNDEYYVKTLANKLDVPVTVELADVTAYAKKEKLSIETAARQLRLAALVRIADKNNCSVIATAHHKNDNAETVIHRILRGTGFKGLPGIPATYVGLPVVGFAVQSFTNGVLIVNGQATLSDYGGNFIHKGTRLIDAVTNTAP
jgi:tRNA(Ile)-lysidine synthase